MVLAGRSFLKKSRSSSVTLENGSLSGAAAGDCFCPSAPACSFRQQAPNCCELVRRTGLQRCKCEGLAVFEDDRVLWGLKCLRAVFSLSVLCKIPAMTAEGLEEVK